MGKHHDDEMEEIERLCQEKRTGKSVPPKTSTPPPHEEKHYDHPNTMENSTATVLYIAVMVIGTIFKDRWLIYIAATIIWLAFITRHSRRK